MNYEIYNKLVRDKIPEIMIKNGAIPVTRTMDDSEYIEELNKKLKEEVNEYSESSEVEELADIEEVLLAILDAKKVSYEEFELIIKNKVLKRGVFKKKIFLEKKIIYCYILFFLLIVIFMI